MCLCGCFRLYEVIETISGIHLILEYAHGGELFARLTSEKGPYKESEAKIIFAQIGSAIQYMVNNNKTFILHLNFHVKNCNNCVLS